MKKKIDVSIVVVSWNTKEILYNCLKSIKKYTKGISYEIVVVDNNSLDGTCEMIKKEFKEVILIESNENLGFAKGNNLAINVIDGEYILLLNPDTLLTYDVLTSLYNYARINKKIGILSPRLLNEDGTFQSSYSAFPSIKELVRYNIVCVLKIPFVIFNKIDNIKRLKISSKEVDWVRGAAMLMSCELFKDINGFDERFFMYNEDADLCYRLKKRGYKVFYKSDDTVVHLYNKSGKQVNLFRERNVHMALALFFKIHNGVVYGKIYVILEALFSVINVILFTPLLFNKRIKSIFMENILKLKIIFGNVR